MRCIARRGIVGNTGQRNQVQGHREYSIQGGLLLSEVTSCSTSGSDGLIAISSVEPSELDVLLMGAPDPMVGTPGFLGHHHVMLEIPCGPPLGDGQRKESKAVGTGK